MMMTTTMSATTSKRKTYGQRRIVEVDVEVGNTGESDDVDDDADDR